MVARFILTVQSYALYVANSPKIGLGPSNLTEITIKFCQLLLKNALNLSTAWSFFDTSSEILSFNFFNFLNL